MCFTKLYQKRHKHIEGCQLPKLGDQNFSVCTEPKTQFTLPRNVMEANFNYILHIILNFESIVQSTN